MRIKDQTARVLIDLPILQAARLQDAHFTAALQRAAFDPFPDGTAATGSLALRGALAQNSGITETQLCGGALTGFDGALPDHIQEALQRGLHNDDDGLKTFLGLFDRRFMALEIRAQRAAVLVASQDAAGQKAASILDRILRMVKQDGRDTRYLKLLFPLLSRVRSLHGLRDLVSWWTQRDARVSANFETLRPIDADSQTRLSARANTAAGLGQGALLGRFGRTPMGRISVWIKCHSRADLDEMVADTGAIKELGSVVAQYLRDPVPVCIYADVPQNILSAPCLSARKTNADRLGAYNILQPQRAADARAAIKLTELTA